MADYLQRISRRDLLQVGGASALGLSLGALLKAEGDESRARSDRNAIFIFLTGGQSHIDSWDPKPEGGESKGEFESIATNVPELRVCEHMPYLAKQADKYAILRNVSHAQGAHSPGQRYLQTGSLKIPSLEYPDYGAVISKERQSPPGVPQYVLCPAGGSNSASYSSGYLGVAYGPFTPNAKNYDVRVLATPAGLSVSKLDARRRLLDRVNTRFQKVENQAVDGMNRSYERAFAILQSKAVRKAFDIASEKDKVRDQYGRHSFGQTCLLARRLVEAGTRCVSICNGGWDTHQNNFRDLKSSLLPPWDQGLAALIADLDERGLLENTVVWCTGEFGRTPKINDHGAGRDHWARAMSMLFAGGGIRGGQVIGATDKTGSAPVGDVYSPGDAAASFYHELGIDHRRENEAPDGRPVRVVADGSPIELLRG